MTPPAIIKLVANTLHVTEDEMKSRSRHHEHVFPRHVACYLLHHVKGMSFHAIGRLFNRHHNAARRAYETIRDLPAKERPQVDDLVKRASVPGPDELWQILGKQALLANGDEIFEATVQKLSDTGDFVRLSINGEQVWRNSNNLTVLEVLGKRTTPQKQKVGE